MCLTPILCEGQYVACRTCDLCIQNRVNDYVGRCLAETFTSQKSYALTLTYKGDVPEAVILTYSDVQKFLKRLRTAGYKVRYLCAGEYGEQKGRAHWHISLFFSGKYPDLEINKRIDWDFWPHGFVYVQETSPSGFRYICKYLVTEKNKDRGVFQKRLTMSKKPPLGYQFFMDWADTYASQGLEPLTYEYSLHGVNSRDGRPKKFFLTGTMRDLAISRFVLQSGKTYQQFRSPLILDWIDKDYRKSAENEALEVQRFEKRILDRQGPSMDHLYEPWPFNNHMLYIDDVLAMAIPHDEFLEICWGLHRWRKDRLNGDLLQTDPNPTVPPARLVMWAETLRKLGV